jgi:hypothetical protein
MFRSPFAFALVLVVFSAASAAAQSASEAPADSHLAAAIDVVNAADIAAPALKLIDRMIPEISARVHSQNPNIDEGTVKAFLDDVQVEMSGSVDEYTRLLALVYEKHFSEDELRALAQFYRSDIGKKYITETPGMVSEIQNAGVAWVGAAVAKATQSAAAHFKDKGLNL